MMKITVICPGNLKETYLKSAASEYLKRLSRYCDITVFEPSPERLPEKPSDAAIAAALEKEADAILRLVPPRSYVTALCVEGKRLTSEAFAENLKELSALGSPLTFIIGSSYGLSPRVKQRADLRLSLSDMTFPHQLFRIMLLEQLYRAFKINEGGSYHK